MNLIPEPILQMLVSKNLINKTRLRNLQMKYLYNQLRVTRYIYSKQVRIKMIQEQYPNLATRTIYKIVSEKIN